VAALTVDMIRSVSVGGVDEPTMRERMLAGEPYITDDDLLREQLRAARLCLEIDLTAPDETARRRGLYTELLGAIGADCEIRPGFRCDYGSHLFLGDRVFANFGLIALDVARITIGDDVQLGPNVQLLTPTHPTDPQARLDKWESAQPISIGANAWLGGGVIVGPGVTIGANTTVGAGAIVTRDLPPNVLAVGNPARVVREL
jgi:maltose O-acetyltransferase